MRSACYYIGATPMAAPLADADLISIPARPAWCKDCNDVCLVEDILPLRAYENAYGATRKGQEVEYPINTEGWDAPAAAAMVKPYVLWRMTRRHPARTLCCGGARYQLLDVAQPLLMHEGCEHGFINGGYFIGSYCGPGPGVRSPADIAVFDGEGELQARLTWFDRDSASWSFEPARYPPKPLED